MQLNEKPANELFLIHIQQCVCVCVVCNCDAGPFGVCNWDAGPFSVCNCDAGPFSMLLIYNLGNW